MFPPPPFKNSRKPLLLLPNYPPYFNRNPTTLFKAELNHLLDQRGVSLETNQYITFYNIVKKYFLYFVFLRTSIVCYPPLDREECYPSIDVHQRISLITRRAGLGGGEDNEDKGGSLIIRSTPIFRGHYLRLMGRGQNNFNP